MKILVTGAAGQLGTALREVLDPSCEVFFTDVKELDITSEDAVAAFFERERPDVVVNCAAWTDVDGAEANEAGARRVNRDAPAILAAECARRDAAIVHISTDFVFDGTGDRPYTEDDAPNPVNVYGVTKLEGEHAVIDSGARGAVIRTSWLYSPWGKNFVKAILNAAGSRPELKVVADQIGCPTSALSLARAIVAAIPRLDSRAEVYQFCDAGVVSRADFAREIIRIGGLTTPVVDVSSDEFPAPARRPLYSAMSTSKFEARFEIAPLRWQEPLNEVINRL